MRYKPEDIEKMGNLHNAVTALIDQSDLSPSDICMVLDMLSENVKALFKTVVMSEEEKDGGNVEEASI